MKIKKFNENKKTKKDCWLALIINNSSEITSSAAFETENDMEYWLLNFINYHFIEYQEDQEDDDEYSDGEDVYNNGSEHVFIDLRGAINWYQDVWDCDVYCDKSQYIKSESLLYNVDKLKDVKKYNL